MRTAEPLAALALASTLAVAGCGEEPASAPLPQPVTDQTHGLAVERPPGWERASGSLTPGLEDPREILSVATFPVRDRPTGCAHVAGSALDDLGPRDAFVTLHERGLDPGATWRDFPPRPAHFGPQLGDPSEASECAPGARLAITGSRSPTALATSTCSSPTGSCWGAARGVGDPRRPADRPARAPRLALERLTRGTARPPQWQLNR